MNWWYSLSKLFTEKNSSWLIHEQIKVLEIKTSMLFNLAFAYNVYNIFSSFAAELLTYTF